MGAFWGDCGCDGQPKLACTDDARRSCRWFVGGCAPEGYAVSPCSVEDICCVDDWPFEGHRGVATHQQLWAWGLEPWDAEREMNVGVIVDPSLEPEEREWTCAVDEKVGSPCEGEEQLGREHYGGTFSLRLSSDTVSFGGWYMLVEVRRGEDPAARVCRLPFTDDVEASCSSIDPEYRDPDPVCASIGLLTLTAMPGDAVSLEDVHGTLTTTFPEGAFEARF